MKNYFVSNLAAIRDAMKLNQREFAKYIGLNESTLSRYTNGKRTANVDVAFQIADKLHITVNQLLCHDLSKGVEVDDELQKLKDELWELNEERLKLRIEAREDDARYGQVLSDTLERYLALVDVYEHLSGKKWEGEKENLWKTKL